MQEDGKVVDGPDLTVKHFSGLTLPNPFVIGSGITESFISLSSQPQVQLTCNADPEASGFEVCACLQDLQGQTMQS